MKLELKNVKHAEFASQETHCFEAKLYVDGVFSAQISNEGRGGSNYVWWEKGVPISEKQIEGWKRKNPKVTKILNTMAFDKALELYQ